MNKFKHQIAGPVVGQALALLALCVLAGCSANSGGPSNDTSTNAGNPGSTRKATAPTLSFKINDATLDPGQSALLTWSSENATTCVGSGGWHGSEPINDSSGISTGVLVPGTWSFGLTCSGPGGSTSDVQTLVVGEPASPDVQIAVSPAAVQPGDSVTIHWSTANATSCTGTGGTGSDGWAAAHTTSNLDGLTVGPLSVPGDVAYELDCTGSGGSGSASQIVTVSSASPPAPPGVTFAANPTSIVTGQSFGLTWNATDATACIASGGSGSDGWSGSKPTSSSGTPIGPINVTGSFTYTLTCTGPGGSSSNDETVAVGTTATPPLPSVQILASPASVPSGSSASLSWSTSNATSCSAGGSWSGSEPVAGSAVSTGTLTTQGVYSFSLTCNGPGGSDTQTAQVTVTQPTASIDSLNANPNTIIAGQTTSLSWSASNATTCTASNGTGTDGWSGPEVTSSNGTTLGPYLSAGIYTYTLSCTGPGGASGPSSATLVVNPAPPNATISSLLASPNGLSVNGSTSLSWSTANATSCAGSGGFSGDGWTGPQPTLGSGVAVGPFTTPGTFTYTLNCTGTGGASTPASATVTVGAATPPASVGTFLASPTSISAGQSTTLSWTTTNATGCTAGGGSGIDQWSGAQAASNSGVAIGPLLVPGTYTYTLTCVGPGGSSGTNSATVAVNVVTPPASITSFSATPNSIQANQSIQLAWTTANATSCTAGGGTGSDTWPGSVGTSSAGTTIGPIATANTYTYTLTCTGPGGSSGMSSISVNVGPGTPPASVDNLAATPNSIQTGGSTALTWSTSNATTCTASGGTGLDGWTGSVPTSSSGTNVGPIIAIGTVTYTLTCTGSGGSSGPSSAAVTVGPVLPPASVVSLNATPTTIQAGQSTSLNWSSSNATTCTASGGTGSDGWSGAEPASSSGTAVGPIGTAGTYTYKLSCTGAGGTSGTTSVPVTVTPAPAGAPVVSISANNASTTQIQPGTSFTLKWSTTNATTCTATGGTGSDSWSGSKTTANTGLAVGPIATPGIYTYALSCSGSGGSGSGSVTVTVISSSSADCGVGVPSTALLAPAATVSSQTSGLCLLGGCGVDHSSRVIDNSLSNYAQMTLGIGVGAVDTLTVSGASVFPAGRKAGFLLSNPNTLLSLTLLQNVNISTLLAGNVQETGTASSLLGLQALGLFADPHEAFVNFTTTKSFDSLRVTLNPLVAVAAVSNVYGACVTLQ